MTNRKFIVVVNSCGNYADRRAAVRRTWFAQMAGRENVLPLFILGSNNPRGEQHVFYTMTPDGRNNVGKITELLRMGASTYPECWFFKCDDDTYVHVDRLIALAQTTPHDYTGCCFWSGCGLVQATGGAGYLLSPRAVKIVVESNAMPPNTGGSCGDGWLEEVVVAARLKAAGIEPTHDGRFNGTNSRWPNPQNQQITCHNVYGAEMDKVHAHCWHGGRDKEMAVEEYGLHEKMRVTKYVVGHGRDQLPIDGELGYDCPLTGGKIVLPPRLKDKVGRLVSAHAPSELEVVVGEDTYIRAGLNASANLNQGNACEAYIDNHWVGDLHDACSLTPEISVPPGKYRLRIGSTSQGDKNWTHSFWSFKTASKQERCALVCIAAWPEKDVKNNARWLMRSAAVQGWLLHVFGANTRYDHFGSKVVSLQRWLGELPTYYQRVMYLDAKDILLIGREDCAAKLLDALGPVVVAGESCVHPERSEAWARQLREKVWSEQTGAEPQEVAPAAGDPVPNRRLRFGRGSKTNLTYINAGMFGGERQAVIAHLGKLAELRARMPEFLRPYQRWRNDDQFLWQAKYLEDSAGMRIDTSARIFGNMSAQHLEFVNPNLTVEDRSIVTPHGTRPLALHFSGYGGHAITAWGGWLLGGNDG